MFHRPATGKRFHFLITTAFVCVVTHGVLRAGESSPPRVYRDRVEPHWFANGTRFWYRNDLPGNKREFILIDTQAGTRAPAFDSARAAEALAAASGLKLSAETLDVDINTFEDDGSAVVLMLGGKAWRLDLKTYAATPATATSTPSGNLLPIDKPHRSSSGGAAARVVFVNKTATPVDLFWMNLQGKREHYAEVKPSDKWDSSTYIGHVWLAVDKNNAIVNVFEVKESSSTAVIGSMPETAPVNAKAPSPASRQNSNGGPKSPDGKWTVTVKEGKLVLRATDSGTETLLGQDGKPNDTYDAGRVWWSPDSKKFVAMRTEPEQEHKVYEVESSPKDQVQPKLKTLNYLKPGDTIAHPRPQLFDVVSKQHVAVKEVLFSSPWSIEQIRWSDDSSRFTFVYNERGHQALRVVAVEASTGNAKALIDETSKTFICYSGKYYCRWIGDKELLWMSERDGWNHIYLYDAQTGKVKTQVTRGEWVVQKVTRCDEENRALWFDAGGIRPGQDPYFTHPCRINLDGTGLVVLTESDGQHKIQYSPDEKYFIDTWSRVDLAPINELRRTDNGKLVCKLEEADAGSVLAARGGPWIERFTAKGRDGKTDIFGVIVYPRGFDPAKKYPVVEHIYAGPQAFFAPKSFNAGGSLMQKIADLGMIVVQCDGMGTSGRSKAFHDVCFKNLRDAGFPDRIAWIKAAAQTRPFMDLTRVGIFGGSAGGQNAMAALLWHNDFYKVAVADCGCHDNRMDKIWWNEQWMSWPVGKEYAENSNAVNAHLMEGKLMLIVGELDSNVDPASTMQVVNALEKANKDFDFVIVTGSNHGAAETPYGSRRRADFLVRNLGVK